MKIIYSNQYTRCMSSDSFSTEKYRHVYNILKERRLITRGQILEAPIASDEDILRVHTIKYLLELYDLHLSDKDEEQDDEEEDLISRSESTLGLTHCEVDVFWRIVGGTILAGEHALADGLCVHLGGGFHNVFPSQAFLGVLNDIAIGLRALLDLDKIRSAAVIDCDTFPSSAMNSIFLEDSRVVLASLHENFAFQYEKNFCKETAKVFTKKNEYIDEIDGSITQLFSNYNKFDLIYYLAGVDFFTEDMIDNLNISADWIQERDRMVIRAAMKNKVPIVITLGGGIAFDSIRVAKLHANTITEAWLAANLVLI